MNGVYISELRKKMSNYLRRDKVKPVLFSVSFVILVLSVSIPILAVIGVQPIGNSAFAQTSILERLNLK